MKICIKCLVKQPIDNFYKKHKDREDRHGICKKCKSDRSKITRPHKKTGVEPMPIATRFRSKVAYHEDTGCHIWTGGVDDKGYGRFAVKENDKWVMRSAHRISYELSTGNSPGELNVCHKCDTPLCVNPDHLFLGTQADNITDAKNKGRIHSGDDHYSRKRPGSLPSGANHWSQRSPDKVKRDENGKFT